ncbi:hypothetical protein HY988_05590 [Candidatus Micrarchaeota archaeon]|nr:hypothetical protein [Candidatus Micrarchaeota archaeon]
MSLVVFAKAPASEKIVNGEKRLVSPFAACVRGPLGPEMGIGLTNQKEGKDQFFGFLSPRLVLTSWRGMRIAQLVGEFQDSTLSACYNAAKKEAQPSDPSVQTIEALIGRRARNNVLTMPVPADEIDNMLRLLMENDHISGGHELESELQRGRFFKKGTIPRTARVMAYLEEYHRLVEREKEEEPGKFVTPSEGRTRIFESLLMGGNVLEWFLSAFDSVIDPRTQIAIVQNTMDGLGGTNQCFIVAQSKQTPDLYIVINAGTFDNFLQIGGRLRLGVIGSNLISSYNGAPALTEKLTGEEPYLGTISPGGHANHPTINVDVKDEAARTLIDQLAGIIEVLRKPARSTGVPS